MYLEKLENLSNSNIVYLKPRRFGKTLFTSMMYYYYDINSAYLYKDTYIYNHETKNRNNYYILKFDFSSMSSNDGTREDIEEKFKNRVIESLNNFSKYYNFSVDIDEKKDVSLILGLYLSQIILDHKLYIII